MTNASGAITEAASYDSFGNSTNNLSTRYQFTGREYDNFTGLHYYRARFYDAQIGRFISEDPIGFAGGDVNLYGYVRDNPNNYTDPFGHQAVASPNFFSDLNKIWKWSEDYFCQDMLPDFIQGSAGFGGISGTATLTRDGDILFGYDLNPWDSILMMRNGFLGEKVGANFGVTAQKILYRGRLSRQQRLNIVGGTSFAAGYANGYGAAVQVSPTEDGNIYSLGGVAGEGLTLGGGQSFQPTIFGQPLRLPFELGSPSPTISGRCGCNK